MKDWYNSLSPRERNIVLYGSIAVAIILVFLLIVKPLYNKKATLNKTIESQKITLATMQEQSIEVGRLQKLTKRPTTVKGNPQQLIDRSLKRWGLKDSLERMQGTKAITLSLNDANADKSMHFLYELEFTHLLSITNMTINGDKEKNGLADFKLTVESIK